MQFIRVIKKYETRGKLLKKNGLHSFQDEVKIALVSESAKNEYVLTS